MGLGGRIGTERRGELGGLRWVEVTRRVFRVEGSESVFVIPAWDRAPGSAKPSGRLKAGRCCRPSPGQVASGHERGQRRDVVISRESEALKENEDLRFRFAVCTRSDAAVVRDLGRGVEGEERMAAAELAHEELERAEGDVGEYAAGS